MEKAKLTQEQVEALEHASIYFENLNDMICCHVEGSWSVVEHEPLSQLSNDTFCRALYVGYEIIEPDQTIVITEAMIRRLAEMSKRCSMETRSWNDGFQDGMRKTLRAIGIELEGSEL